MQCCVHCMIVQSVLCVGKCSLASRLCWKLYLLNWTGSPPQRSIGGCRAADAQCRTWIPAIGEAEQHLALGLVQLYTGVSEEK